MQILLVLGGGLAIVLSCVLAKWVVQGGCKDLYARTVVREASRKKIKSFREAGHEESVTEATTKTMGKALKVGVFDERGRRLSDEEDWDDGDVTVKKDAEDGMVLNVFLHMMNNKTRPLTVQTNKPLAQAVPEIDKHVYYEVTVKSLDMSTRLAVGWATAPYPPFDMPGHSPHSVALMSAGETLVPNLRNIEGQVGLMGDSGKLIVRTSADAVSSGLLMPDEECLEEGDVVGCGYYQVLDPTSTPENPKLIIRFYWVVNHRLIMPPGKYVEYPAINTVWDARQTNRAVKVQDDGDVDDRTRQGMGVLANGTARPTIGATGPVHVALRTSPPFQFKPEHFELSSYQGMVVERRRSIALAASTKELLAPELAKQAADLDASTRGAMRGKAAEQHHLKHKTGGGAAAPAGRRRSFTHATEGDATSPAGGPEGSPEEYARAVRAKQTGQALSRPMGTLVADEGASPVKVVPVRRAEGDAQMASFAHGAPAKRNQVAPIAMRMPSQQHLGRRNDPLLLKGASERRRSFTIAGDGAAGSAVSGGAGSGTS